MYASVFKLVNWVPDWKASAFKTPSHE